MLLMDPKKGKTSETFLSISRRELGKSIFNSNFDIFMALEAFREGERARKKKWK